MKHLVIVGAGGFGREMFGTAREAVGFGTEFDIKGFLDAKPTALDGFVGYPPIVGSPDSYVPAEDDVFITALGSIASRRRCVSSLEKKGAKFISIIHRTSPDSLSTVTTSPSPLDTKWDISVWIR